MSAADSDALSSLPITPLPGGGLTALARAKVNLFLHVVGRRPDGYHLLDSLVAFPEIGDLIEVEPASGLSLSLDGPQGPALDAGPDNLVLQAAAALREAVPGAPGAAIRLVKRLPVASGIGGGSTDAAATLLLLDRLWGADLAPERLAAIGVRLGADVPVCLGAPRMTRMGGIGEILDPAPPPPRFWLLLANPGVPVATPAAFKALAGRFGAPAPETPAAIETLGALLDWLGAARNDLEAPAQTVAPAIGAVLAALRAAEGCLLARMSGSGATCWGVFETEATALEAQARLAAARPDWWLGAGPVMMGR